MVSVSTADVPERVCKAAGRYPQPVALLACLGIDVDHEGRGVGAGLLEDVIVRTHALGQGDRLPRSARACRDLRARDLHLHLVPEFDASPTGELYLRLLMKDIRRSRA